MRLGRLTCAYNDIWWKRLLFEGALKKSKQQFPLTNHFCHQGRVSIVDDFEKPQIMPYALVFDCSFVCLFLCPVPILYRFLPPTISACGNQFMIKSRLLLGQVNKDI